MKNKRKGIVLAASILGSVAIVSTGFASWVITRTNTQAAEGTINVDTIDAVDHMITLGTFVYKDSSGNDHFGESTTKYDKVYFGADSKIPSGATAPTNPWMTVTNDENHPGEVLTVEIPFTVTNVKADTASFIGLSIVSDSIGGNAQYTAAVNKGYIKALDGNSIAIPTVEQIKSNNGSGTIVVTFKWGAFFGEKNPYLFYNQWDATTKVSTITDLTDGHLEGDAVMFDDAKIAMSSAEFTGLSSATFNFTVKVDAARN